MTAYNFSQIVPYNSMPAKYAPGQYYSIEFEYSLTGALANADTITTPANALPYNGIRVMETEVICPELDTNTTPTATFNLGDADLATRFISGGILGVNGITTAGFQLTNRINVAQTLTNGVVTAGAGYFYGSNNQSVGPQLVMTISNAFATGATTGLIRLKVFFYCEGQ